MAVLCTVDFHQSGVSSSSVEGSLDAVAKEVQKAIRDEEFHDCLVEHLELNQNIIWQPNPRGWTAMHIACCSPSIPLFWFKWLLEKASVTTPERLLYAETESGQTPINLFFRQNLDSSSPGLISRFKKLEAMKLQKAMTEMSQSENSLKEFKLYRKEGILSFRKKNGKNDDDGSFKIVLDFMEKLECLLCVACYGSMEIKFRNLLEREILIVLACLPGGCPDVVALFFLRLFPPDENMLHESLEIWAKNTPNKCCMNHHHHHNSMSSSTSSPSAGLLLESISKIFSKEVLAKGARHLSINGRFPLQVALSMGRPWREVSALFAAYPDVLSKVDPFYQVPTFCLPAIVPIEENQVEDIARKQTSIWKYMRQSEKKKTKEAVRMILEIDRLNTIYQLLRRDPSQIVDIL